MKEKLINPFDIRQIACYMRQLLEVLEYLHRHSLVHRDIKCSNLLVSKDNVIKLADFGLARFIHPNSGRNYTNKVITLWYRPPELLLGSKNYTSSVDMWSVGCILAELLIGKPLFPAKEEMDQIGRIFNFCGTPTEESWPEHSSYQFWDHVAPREAIPNTMVHKITRLINDHMVNLDPAHLADVVDLLTHLLDLNPSRRYTAKDAMRSKFFENIGYVDPRSLPPIDIGCGDGGAGLHEFGTKNLKKGRKDRDSGGGESVSTKVGRPGDDADKEREKKRPRYSTNYGGTSDASVPSEFKPPPPPPVVVSPDLESDGEDYAPVPQGNLPTEL